MSRLKKIIAFGLGAAALAAVVHLASINSIAQDDSINSDSRSRTPADKKGGASSKRSGRAANPSLPGGTGIGGMMMPGMGGGRQTMSMGGMPGMGTSDPYSESESQIQALVAQYGDLGDDKLGEKKDLADQLTKLVNEQFELRQENRENELAALEEQVRRLREIHAKRNAQKDKIVADRVQQLLRNADGLGWGTDNVNIPGSQTSSSMPPVAYPTGSGFGVVAPAVSTPRTGLQGR